MIDNTTDMLCDTPAVERPRYFPRQLITPEDLIMEQDYFRNRMRMHNRLLHGWGVVCGALVSPAPAKNGSGSLEPWLVRVCPGFILGPYGDEIVIACEQEIDLRQNSLTGSAADPCGMGRDPWCGEIWIERDPSAKLYLAVKYREMAVRPVRVQPGGCGCDESRCEFSRLRDGYEIRVLTEAEYQQVKMSGATPPAWNELFKAPNTHNPSCWPCPSQPWVALASITVDDSGRPILIDNCGPRRLVAALGGFHWMCATGVSINSVSPAAIQQGDQNLELTITGEGFQSGLKVVLGKGVTVTDGPYDLVVNTTPNSFKVKVNVGADAETGSRNVVVINPDCSYAASNPILEVTPRPLIAPGPERPSPVERVAERVKEAPVEDSKTPSAKPKPPRKG